MGDSLLVPTSNASPTWRVAPHDPRESDPQPWSTAQFAHWLNEPRDDASRHYRETGELPSDPADADDVLRWLISNKGHSQLEQFLAADAARPEGERAVRQLTLRGSHFDPDCMRLLGKCQSLTSLILEKSLASTPANDADIVGFVCSHEHLESLRVVRRSWDSASIAALFQGLQQPQAPRIQALDLEFEDGEYGAGIADCGDYLANAAPALESIRLLARSYESRDGGSSPPELPHLLESVSKNKGLAPRSLSIEYSEWYPSIGGQRRLDPGVAELISTSSGRLEKLSLIGVLHSYDGSRLNRIPTLREVDVSMPGDTFVDPHSNVVPTNTAVMDLIALSGGLDRLAARNRNFDPRHPGNPSLWQVGSAFALTRLQSLDLADCVFSDEQRDRIVGSILQNTSLTHVVLPDIGFTAHQRQAVHAALQRNRVDHCLGADAGAALHGAFEQFQVPREIAHKIAGHARDGLPSREYYRAGGAMAAINRKAHAEARQVLDPRSE